jgi:hypothetical protein
VSTMRYLLYSRTLRSKIQRHRDGLSKSALQDLVRAQNDKWPVVARGKFTQKTNMSTMRAVLLDRDLGFTIRIHPCPMCPMRPSKGCKTARMWINPWLRRVRVATCRISTVTVPQVSLVFRFRRIVYRMCGKGPPLSSVATGGNAVPASPENGMSVGINDNFSTSARDSLQGTFSGSEWCLI